ncbi:hypothetical protein [Actinoalloteichus spitiensis]|uniref:hypothetical protein n=1 Tax=Actinoalloteichus spitiensis TaxID=252394 RepID=UPI0003723938|nr:hypothetical protein [Actinoalloteichus spitiensis]
MRTPDQKISCPAVRRPGRGTTAALLGAAVAAGVLFVPSAAADQDQDTTRLLPRPLNSLLDTTQERFHAQVVVNGEVVWEQSGDTSDWTISSTGDNVVVGGPVHDASQCDNEVSPTSRLALLQGVWTLSDFLAGLTTLICQELDTGTSADTATGTDPALAGEASPLPENTPGRWWQNATGWDLPWWARTPEATEAPEDTGPTTTPEREAAEDQPAGPAEDTTSTRVG